MGSTILVDRQRVNDPCRVGVDQSGGHQLASMPMSTNGRIPADQLATVAVGVQLLTGAANAYRALVAQAAHEHCAIKPAPGVGSGYRDLELQELFYRAWQGDKAARKAV